MTPEEFVLLYDYNSWANHRLLDASSALSNEQFLKPLGSSFSSVRDTLAHICAAEWIWAERFQGRSPSAFPDISQFSDVGSLRAHWATQERSLLAFVRTLTQEKIDGVMEYQTMKFGAYRNPMWQSLQHVVNHGTYHRGQVTTMLRQHGAQPLSTDMIHFYRESATSVGA
jgi:uncharacterized damage-inducible protein DinB